MSRSYLIIYFADMAQEVQEVKLRENETKANRVFENDLGLEYM